MASTFIPRGCPSRREEARRQEMEEELLLRQMLSNSMLLLLQLSLLALYLIKNWQNHGSKQWQQQQRQKAKRTLQYAIFSRKQELSTCLEAALQLHFHTVTKRKRRAIFQLHFLWTMHTIFAVFLRLFCFGSTIFCTRLLLLSLDSNQMAPTLHQRTQKMEGNIFHSPFFVGG